MQISRAMSTRWCHRKRTYGEGDIGSIFDVGVFLQSAISFRRVRWPNQFGRRLVGALWRAFFWTRERITSGERAWESQRRYFIQYIERHKSRTGRWLDVRKGVLIIWVSEFICRKFQREWEEKIAAKGKEQERLDREWKEAAQNAYEKFQRDGVARRNARQAANRAHEEAALEKLAADLDSPNPWERVVSLIELDPRNRSETLKEASKTGGKKVKNGSQNSPLKPERKRGAQDQCARMRQLFIQLKSEPLNTTRAIESRWAYGLYYYECRSVPKFMWDTVIGCKNWPLVKRLFNESLVFVCFTTNDTTYQIRNDTGWNNDIVHDALKRFS